MVFTLTDEGGNDHQVAPVLNVDGTRTVRYDRHPYSAAEARRLAHALLDAAAAIEAAPAG